MPKAKFSDEDLTRWKREINPAPIIGARISLRRENSEYIGTCPPQFHEARVGHLDKTPSFKVYKLADGTWGFKCFGCGVSGNVYQFVQTVDKVSFTKAVETVLTEAGVSGWQDGDEQVEPTIPDQAPKETVTFPMSHYVPTISALERSAAGQKWLLNRGISLATARQFSIGFVQSADKITSNNLWMNDGWVLFPTISADRQTVTAVKYRSVMGKKTKDNSGILRAPHTSTTLFNLPAISPTDDIWIVEGEPDTLVVAQAGFRTVGYPSGAYNPTEDECEALSTAPRRFLAGDNDQTGEKVMSALFKRLRGATFFIKWPNNRKDANDVLTNECGNDPTKFKELIEDLKARATQTETEPILRPGNEIKPKRIKWLWENKIPLGKITLFAGNPDNGKSLASTSVASICTTGEPFPESSFSHAPADVLMMIGEDDIEDTAVPRLMAANATMKRIHFLEAVRPVKKDDREVRLDFDIPAIERHLATNTDIRLLIIDPISNYLGDVSMVAEQEVRSILIPLKRLAEKFNVAVVLVMHLNKKSDLDAISRVGGAMAFIGVARCSWLFVREVKDAVESEEGVIPDKTPDTFSMLRIKNNLVSSSRAGLSYSVAVRPIPIEGESDIITPYIVWGKVIEGSADEALGGGGRRQAAEPVTPKSPWRPNDKFQQATKFLEEYLQDGLPHESMVVQDAALHGESNIAKDTLYRAYAALPGHKPAFPKMVGGGGERKRKAWFWQLEPMNEGSKSDDEPQESDLINYGDAE